MSDAAGPAGSDTAGDAAADAARARARESQRGPRPYVFLLVTGAVLALVNTYVGLRLLPSLPFGMAVRAIAIAVLGLSVVLVPAGVLARFLRRQWLARALAWASALTMGWLSSLVVLTLLREIALGLAILALPRAARADLGTWSALAVLALAVAATVAGWIGARRRPRVKEVQVALPDLPAPLQGFVIVQISDLHVSATLRRHYVDAVVDSVNGLDADLVAITGDLVDGSVAQLAPQVEPLRRLASRHGTYFVTGNHEYYSGADAWTAQLRRLGLHVLLNEHVVIEHGGAGLVLAGVTDTSAHQFDPARRSDPRSALDGAPARVRPRVLLAHRPRSAPAAAAAGFDLQLSGHTHGGQFWPWNLIVRWQEPLAIGLDRLDGLWVYTSRGTGYWGPPQRLGVPSEITRLRLVRAPG
ncbi:MAG TPA: metallophosphoesterase [Steroidobacteraceae bacterium]|nr:metallophosphoesterase [Steroidobacteraceae bacterium]